MAIPTVSVAMWGFRDPDNHRLAVGRDGLTRVISPLQTHDYRRDPEASEEANEMRRRAMMDRSRKVFLAMMQGSQIGYSYTVSQVVRDHPERAVRIPGSRVWVVVMPPVEWEKMTLSKIAEALVGESVEDYVVAVLDGTGHVETVTDGPALLRQAHYSTGRPHSISIMRSRGMQRQREDPWNGRALAADEAVPDHLPEAVAVIGATYMIQQRPSFGGASAGMKRAVAAVRELGGESAKLLERVLQSLAD